ncbi:TetR/AcrR family transcriptional regulator [Shimia ponticola]|uniref:TetR/AcrR family transcriptional regulator n=1 Tax=Shimia ponticola TaxID=2582893 RepID=UPI0011BE2276|nr:TetR/AcrR family transcriptional regulator [Shimia ponticola]
MARKTGSHSDITGPKVQDAALRLFARDGFAAVSMRQIASEVGVQAGALYNYTPDKQTLLFSLLKGHMDELLSQSPDAIPSHLSADQALAAFVEFHITYHIDRSDLVFISYMELRSLEPANFARIEAARRAYEDQLEAILRRGQADGVFRIEDSKLATLALIAMLTGVTNWFRRGGRLQIDDVTRHYVQMALRIVGADKQ